MSLGSNRVGLPGVYTNKVKETSHKIIIGDKEYTLKIKNKSHMGNPVGFNYTINDSKKIFCNRLTRDEVIESAKKRIESGNIIDYLKK